MEVVGKVRMVDSTKEVGSNGFKKRDIVVTTEEQYPQHISIQFVQDKTSLLDSFRPGDNVKVSINLRGREWVNPQGETVYFNTIQGWKIEKLVPEAPAQNIPSPAMTTPSDAFEPAQNINESDHDDLPF
jgi:translation initiation factor IF-3